MICLCDENDLQAVGDLYDKTTAFLETHVNYPHWRHKIYPSYRYVQESFRAGALYKICVDDKIVGAFALNEDPQGNYAKADWQIRTDEGEYLVLHALAIDPDQSRKGLARQAVSEVVSQAFARGYKALRVDVVPDNFPAKRLYESLGFVYRGDVDLERGFADIPLFSMYELIAN